MAPETGSSTMKLSPFSSGSRLKGWGTQITAVAHLEPALPCVTIHVGNLFNSSVYPAQAMPVKPSRSLPLLTLWVLGLMVVSLLRSTTTNPSTCRVSRGRLREGCRHGLRRIDAGVNKILDTVRTKILLPICQTVLRDRSSKLPRLLLGRH